MIDWGKITSNEFESLALDYAKFKYKEYTWYPTREKKDDNHDFYYIETDEEHHEWEGWGEAKHSGSTKKIMSREKWDQTIVSGQLAQNVKHLIFITNARIPFSYIFRAECLKTPPYEKFEYINNTTLEQWLYTNQQFIPQNLKPFFSNSYIPQKNYIKINFYIIDYFTPSKNILHELKELYANKDYLLLVIIECNYATQLDIQFEPHRYLQIMPYEVENISNVNISAGIVCKKSIIRFTESGNIKLNMMVKSLYKNKGPSCHKNYLVYRNFTPKLIYNAQLKIVEDLLVILQSEENINCLLMLYAPKGTGKTYLLNMLSHEYKLYNQTLFLTFTGAMEDCARNICTLFLAVNFGTEFSDKYYWNEISKFYNRIPESEKTMMMSELQKIYDGTQKNDSAASMLAVQYIEKFLLKYNLSLLNSGIHQYLILICDDIHKVPIKFQKVMILFIKKFCKEKKHSYLIFSGREYEFKSKQFNQIVKNIASKSFKLKIPSLTERKQSLHINFNFIRDIEYYSGILNKCNSTMLLCILFRRINKFIKTNGENEALLQIQIAKIYKQICLNTHQLDWDEFMFYSKDFNIIFPIYFYQSGLNINIFNSAKDREKIHYLFEAGIIDIQGEYLFPSHDIYRNIFEKLCNTSKYNNIKKKTATFFYNNLNNEYIDQYKVLPILIMLDPQNKELYLENSICLIKEYYDRTEYGKMNLLCEKIVKTKYSDIDNGTWTKDKLWLFYLYADCLDHCGSLYKSREYFSLVFDNGYTLMENNSFDFIWDAKAQIFNIQYYLLEIRGLALDINIFLYDNFSKIKNVHSMEFEVAYLNSLNRRMMVAFLSDEYEVAESISETYKNLAIELHNNNHQAYYYIDYARGLYHCNPYYAFSLMKSALNKFSKIPSEKRRLLDAESEYAYLNCILNNGNIEKLEEISERIASNGYIHIYANTLLKRAAIRILKDDLLIARNLLLKISLIIELEDFPRTRLLFSNLMAAICFLEGDNITANQHIKIQNKLAEQIGKSYQIFISLTNISERKVKFNYNEGIDFFPLETRLW